MEEKIRGILKEHSLKSVTFHDTRVTIYSRNPFTDNERKKLSELPGVHNLVNPHVGLIQLWLDN